MRKVIMILLLLSLFLVLGCEDGQIDIPQRRAIPSGCVFTSAGVACEDVRITGVGNLHITLRNGMGMDLNDVEVLIYEPDTKKPLCTTQPTGTGAILSDSEIDTFSGSGCLVKPSGIFQGDIFFMYTTEPGTLRHTMVGGLLAKVE